MFTGKSLIEMLAKFHCIEKNIVFSIRNISDSIYQNINPKTRLAIAVQHWQILSSIPEFPS